MTREAARIAVTTKLEQLRQTWTDYPLVIEVENTLIDISNQTNPYLCVEINYVGGFQQDLNPNPRHRIVGGIMLSAVVKVGTGSLKADKLLSHFYPAFQMTDSIPPLHTQAAEFLPNNTKNGWEHYRVIVPFYYDDIRPRN